MRREKEGRGRKKEERTRGGEGGGAERGEERREMEGEGEGREEGRGKGRGEERMNSLCPRECLPCLPPISGSER